MKLFMTLDPCETIISKYISKISIYFLIVPFAVLFFVYYPSIAIASSNNLIQNPSFEDMDENGQPLAWLNGIWLSNDSQFVYPVPGYNGGQAAKITMSSYTDGDAKWYFEDVQVSPGVTYEFSDYYMSDVTSNITFRFLTIDNTYTYKGIEDLAPSTEWKKYTKTILIPDNVKSVTLFHLIESVGYLTVDEFSLIKKDITLPPFPDATTFSEGMVSFTFDDARMSQYLVGFSVLELAGFKGTFYPHIVDFSNMDTSSFYHPEHMLIMQSAGHEIGSHTRMHAHLKNLSIAERFSEINGSRLDLFNYGATPVSSFCYPYGEYNDDVIQSVKDAGYTNARSVNRGYNKKNTNKYELLIQEVNITTTESQVKSWIDTAIDNSTWLILTFHQIDYSNNKNGTTPEIFKSAIDYSVANNIKVVTINDGVALMD